MARDGDLAAVESIADEAFAPYIERIGQKPAPMLADYAELINAGKVWVAVEEAAVSGFCVLIAANDHLMLDVVAVATTRQRQGIGRRLIAFAEEYAGSAGIVEIRLYTNEAMVENLRLYPRLGYQEVSRSTVKGFRRVYFTKRLG